MNRLKKTVPSQSVLQSCIREYLAMPTMSLYWFVLTWPVLHICHSRACKNLLTSQNILVVIFPFKVLYCHPVPKLPGSCDVIFNLAVNIIDKGRCKENLFRDKCHWRVRLLFQNQSANPGQKYGTWETVCVVIPKGKTHTHTHFVFWASPDLIGILMFVNSSG